MNDSERTVMLLEQRVIDLEAALTRLIDVDMGLRDQISRHLPDGPGLVLSMRGILTVQQAKDALAAASSPAVPPAAEDQ